MNKCRTDSQAYHDPDVVMTVAEEMKAELNSEVHLRLVFDQLVHGDLDKSLKIIKQVLLCDEPLLESVVRELLNRSGREYPLPGVETKVNKAIEIWASEIDLEDV